MQFSDFTLNPKNPLEMIGPDGYKLFQDLKLEKSGRGRWSWRQVPSGFFYPSRNGCSLVSTAYQYAFSFEGAFAKLMEFYPELLEA